ncbi:hypothetical protein [Sphingosinicella terrae]|uniref:hypothetical protein n=1 Tax=Sphingosinicella terrae TaxID=2172047 RepID=UPI000E0D1FC1|nr:hypothetical protein [Sphingosinicella terrae]
MRDLKMAKGVQQGHFHPRGGDEPRHLWEHPAALAALVLLSALPLLWPDVPPLLDLPGHMGRYRVQLDLETSAHLRRYYAFEWALIGNLGVDLLVQLLAPAIGLEPAVKLIIILIPVLTVIGLLWVAFEVHGRIPPTSLFALPLAYNFPFLFGFANFALSMALALIAFALWLRLARLDRLWLRAALFPLVATAVWVAHAFGWGTLGVLAFSAELVRQYDRGHHFIASGFRAAIHCLTLTPPVALILLWRSEASGRTTDWFNMERKLEWLRMVLRDRWEIFDVASLVMVSAVIAWAMVSRRLTYSRNLAASALFLSIVFVLLPRIVFGSAYADMRLAPYLFAIGLIAIRFPEGVARRLAAAIGMAGLAFFGVRTAGTTVSMWLYDRVYDRELAALDHVPEGARLVSFVGRPCVEPWAMSRLVHLPGLAIVRRQAFSNDQWFMAGAQLLRVTYAKGLPFVGDPTQIITQRRCRWEVWRPVGLALATFPREAFDYVWLITPPPFDPALTKDLRPIWRSGSSVLYRVEREPISANSETPTGNDTRPTR